jgi:hypothetical protein
MRQLGLMFWQDIELLNVCSMAFTIGVEYNQGSRVLGACFIVLTSYIEAAKDDGLLR